ncbi:hypothetical protein CSOJ01_06085 [Colletotrichum sojae]|uniref:Extracellular membrane protein CFEM domain-containing protein n=1 Tax=Colletotrichum sojae TaxID=2175907 RepID=A0A8H6JE43_9PEZI|nr:hypothetical protein CSOJ01_06085 [Colletotrichum sojae]
MPRPAGLRSPSSRPAATAGLLLLLCCLTSAATTTGALARVSIYSELAYSTARACAAGCLVYNGAYPCGTGGYQDLGVALQCGCQSINGCYCNTGLASSASAYISSCVSRGCSKVENWSVDLTSMLNLYDSYCATANEAFDQPSKVPATATPAGGGSSPTNTNDAKVPSDGQATRTAASGASGTSAADAQQSSGAAAGDSGGLSRSDIVALAASLGVGIPSLLIAGLTLYFQIKKKKKKADAAASPISATQTQSTVQMTPADHGYGYSGAYGYGNTPSPGQYAAGAKGWQYP